MNWYERFINSRACDWTTTVLFAIGLAMLVWGLR